jgi:thioredoxin reductase (NADPH)
VLIIGSGPAGFAAAIYASRAGRHTIVVEGLQPGGQLTITTDVENYPGFADVIQGPWLMQQMRAQAAHVGARLVSDMVASVDFSATPLRATGDNGDTYNARSVIITTGAQARWLGLPSEQKFNGRGVSACATCDGFFYRDKTVAVIGGGNTAVEEALYLANLAVKVYLVHRRDALRAEKVLQNRLFAHPKIEPVWNHVVEEVVGGSGVMDGVTGLRLKNVNTGEPKEIAVEGMFVAIGHDPATGIFKDQVTMDEAGYIVTAAGRTETNVAGVFAAGDVTDHVYCQAVTAAGMGCMAALDADRYLGC